MRDDADVATTGEQGGTPDGSAGPGDDAAETMSGWARLSDAVAPRGPFQVAVAIAALCFLAGAVGFLVGTRRPPVPTNAVEEGFLIDMSTHHDQAVTMSLCAAGKAQDPVVDKFAKEVLIFQNRELGLMRSWLEQRGVSRPGEDEDRPAMAWMDMTSTAATMPGMATPEDLDALCAATGADLDRRFLVLMRAHHLGGVHMAEHAAEHGASERVRSFARAMARNQRIEANEYAATLKRLGLV